jgi:hypothetical protein
LKKWSRLVALAIFVLLAIWFVLAFFPSDEQKIKEQLTRLAETVSVTNEEGNISRGIKASRASGYFTPEISFEVEGPRDQVPPISNGTELQQSLMQLFSTTRNVEVKFLDLFIKISDDKVSATALATAVVRLNNEPQPSAQELKLHLQKEKGQWLIHSLQAIQTIQ